MLSIEVFVQIITMSLLFSVIFLITAVISVKDVLVEIQKFIKEAEDEGIGK